MPTHIEHDIVWSLVLHNAHARTRTFATSKIQSANATTNHTSWNWKNKKKKKNEMDFCVVLVSICSFTNENFSGYYDCEIYTHAHSTLHTAHCTVCSMFLSSDEIEYISIYNMSWCVLSSANTMSLTECCIFACRTASVNNLMPNAVAFPPKYEWQ